MVLISILAYGFYWWTIARFYEETDNAYVNGNIIPITSQVAGTVVAVNVDDTQFVKEGQVLVQLDPIDTYIALEQAKANLAEVLRNTQQLFINNKGLIAAINERQISLDKARQDLERRNQAISLGAVSKEELTHAKDTLEGANASLVQAKSALLSNLALTENTNLKEHPNVLAAAATLRKAYIDYRRTAIKAPTSGEVSRRAVQVGQRIDAGVRLMAIVPLEQVWVDANFKEKQLRNMRIGQPVELTADIYGSSINYKGKIVGFSAGTGSAFALLPAQNATGNWIKIVQRLPVRIAISPDQLAKHPLRIGLSMQATVDMHDTSGKLVSEVSPNPSLYKTSAYDELAKEADVEILKIINENAGKTANLGKKYQDIPKPGSKDE
ncbi:MAG: HlyD family efflux transporter periplasmic adaptor subunit [Proteobacteria bacterium]|nr:HlyD family efflux transporter periplasmic adaptor subunit [Pseudomonadota bacterium]